MPGHFRTMGLAGLVCACAIGGARAADFDNFFLRGPVTPYAANYGPSLASEQTEFGVRAWISSGSLEKTINGPYGSGVGAVSRLRYEGMNGYSGEVYGRVGVAGWSFFKGFVGLGELTDGSLQDEDFEPITVPYSSTQSAQRHGALDYGTLDYGVDFIRNPLYRLDLFVGGNYLRQVADAYGCTETASNPNICPSGAVAANTLAITENSDWISARVGLGGDVLVSDRLQLGAEAAWLPYVWVTGVDTHWLRTDIGPIQEKGHGTDGVQLEATASYALTSNFSLGAGVRYWRMTAHANSTIVDPSGVYLTTEPTDFVTQRLGGFVQAAYRF